MTDEKKIQETATPEEKSAAFIKKTPAEEEPRVLSELEKREALEAILFAAGYALPYDRLAALLGFTPGRMKRFAEATAKEYNAAPGRGILLLTMEDRCQLCTKAEYKNYIREALGIRLSGKLSASSLEVLAIVAYHQPVTKAYIEQVRGSDCSYAIGSLCDKSLIEPKGRLETPGRPLLYGTTDDFLRCFGISSLDELPEYTESTRTEPGASSEAAPIPNQLSFLTDEENDPPKEASFTAPN